MFRALTNLAEADFDSLRVRHPPHTGEMTRISDIVSGAAFNPSTMQGDIAQNTAAHLVNAAAISALDSNLVGKQDVLSNAASNIRGWRVF